MKFPEILQPYAESLLATSIDSIVIHANKEETTTLQSKFGGKPYWLKKDPYPLDENGSPLYLLAQINFAEMNITLPHFPTTGILQFFIATDGVYGLNSKERTKQTNFRVVYHENIEENEEGWLQAFEEITDIYSFPLKTETGLSFEITNEIISAMDFRFNLSEGIEKLLVDHEEVDLELLDELTETYYEFSSGDGHKMGGYPFFAQEDPRTYGDYPDHLILLLQIDTDDENQIMWGDSGVGNFFISKADLKNRDFSNVLYNWDCF